MAALYVALIHGPVLNKRGDRITTATTGLSVHDIARATATFGGAGFFLVTPLTSQQALVERMTRHWQYGSGAGYNPNRKVALEFVQWADTLQTAVAQVQQAEGQMPQLVATSAKPVANVPAVEYAELGQQLAAEDGLPTLLLLGTGWGLPADTMVQMDAVLPPIFGASDYNHLSVRSAAAIILDRLRGK